MADDLFRRRPDGRFDVALRAQERELLRAVSTQLRETLTGETAPDDPAIARLFPPAYPDDPLRNLDFDDLAADGLLRGRLQALDVLDRTVDASRITEEDLLMWMRTVNDVRLVLGTRLDVTEDTDFEDFEADEESRGAFAVYAYLSALLDAMVRALGDPVP